MVRAPPDRGLHLLKQPESLLGFAGPTLINCFLPFFFIGDWIYLDWYALYAATCNFQQDRSRKRQFSAVRSSAVVDPAPRPDRRSRTHGGLIRPSPLIPVGHPFRSCHARVHDHKVRPDIRARSHRAGRQRAHGSRRRSDGRRGDRWRRRGRRRGRRVHGQRDRQRRGGPRHDPVHRLRAELGGLGQPDERPADPGTAAAGRRRDAALPGRLLRRHLQLAGQHRAGRLRGPGDRLRLVHGHGAEDRRAADPHRQLRDRHPAGGGGLGPVRQHHQGLRRQVLGDRQRALRQRRTTARTGRPTTTPSKSPAHVRDRTCSSTPAR